MTKIKQYELDSTIHEDDKVIGTDGNPGVDLGRTKNFTIAALTNYLNTALEIDDMIGGSGTLNTIPMWTPDGTTLGDSIIVKDPSVLAPDEGIVIKGKFRIDTTGQATDVGKIAEFSNNIVLRKNVEFKAGIYDNSFSLGTSGQVLTSTGTAVSWVDVSALSGNVDGSGTLNTIPIWTPDGNTLGDSVLTYDAPNTEMTLTGKLVVTSTANIQGNLTSEGGLTVDGYLADGAGAQGTAGQILSSTGTATQWIDGVPSNNIVGSGTLDTIAMFTPDGQTIGNSGITKTGATAYQIAGTLVTTTSVETTVLTSNTITGQDGGSVSLLGNVFIGNSDTDTLTVTSTSTFNNNVTIGSSDVDEFTVNSSSDFNGNVIFDPPGYVEFRGALKDAQGDLGTSGQVLVSTVTGVNWVDQTDTTYTHNSAQVGSDAVIRLTDGVTNQDVTLVAGNSISLTDDGSNNITIAATGGAANTTYDLDSIQTGNDVAVTLVGSDATIDTLTLVAGTNVTLTDDGSNNITVATVSDIVTGSGTLNTLPMWTPDGTQLGDSYITTDTTGSPFTTISVPLYVGTGGNGTMHVQNVFAGDGGFVTLNGNTVLGNASTDIVSVNGTATFNANVTLGNTSSQDLTVNAVTVFNSSARFASQLVDTGGASGVSGMVLTSTGTGVDWVNVSDLTDNVTGSGTAGKLPYWNPDGSTLADSLISQTSDNSITIGVGATATGSEAISLSRSEARADYSFAHGYESITDGEFSVTLGKGGYTAGDHSAAIGYKGISLGQSAISGGHSSSAGGDGAIALGHNASAGNYGVAKATSTFPNDQTTFDIYGIVGTVAVGTFLRYGPGFDVADPRIEVTQFTDLGNGAATITIASGIRPIADELLVFEEQTPQRNDHQGGVALGNDAFSLGQGAVSLGQDAVADADFAVAIGKASSTSTEDSIALGGGSTKILIQALVNAISYADDTAAAAGGVAIGQLYRNGNVVQIRLT